MSLFYSKEMHFAHNGGVGISSEMHLNTSVNQHNTSAILANRYVIMESGEPCLSISAYTMSLCNVELYWKCIPHIDQFCRGEYLFGGKLPTRSLQTPAPLCSRVVGPVVGRSHTELTDPCPSL